MSSIISLIPLVVILYYAYFIYNYLSESQKPSNCKIEKNHFKPKNMSDIRVVFHGDKVTLLWDPVENADSYEIYAGYENICKPRIHITHNTIWTTDQRDTYINIYPTNSHGSGNGNAEDIHILQER